MQPNTCKIPTPVLSADIILIYTMVLYRVPCPFHCLFDWQLLSKGFPSPVTQNPVLLQMPEIVPPGMFCMKSVYSCLSHILAAMPSNSLQRPDQVFIKKNDELLKEQDK